MSKRLDSKRRIVRISDIFVVLWKIFASVASLLLIICFVLLLHCVGLNMLTANRVAHASDRSITYCGPRTLSINSKWPPSNLSSIRNPTLGLYDLTLKPSVIPKVEGLNDIYYELLESVYDGEKTNGSRLNQLVMMDRAVRMGGSNPDFNLYPQMMDVVGAVKSIRSGLPVDKHPVNNPNLIVIESPKFTCSHATRREMDVRGTYPLNLVILVKSCVECSERRMRARSSYIQSHLWSGFRIQHAFVVGLPFIQASSHVHFGGVSFAVRQKIANGSQLKQARRILFNESARYNDLLVGNFHDSYYNLTLKQIFTFRWASAFCKDQTPLFLFIDDDMSVNPTNLIRFINRLPVNGKVYFNGGMFLQNLAPVRPESAVGRVWAVSKNEFPWDQYPSYSHGRGYLVGADCVCDAAVAMAFTRFFRIDDTFLGIVWVKLRYSVLNIPGFRTRISNAREFNETMVASSSSMDNYINWKTGEAK